MPADPQLAQVAPTVLIQNVPPGTSLWVSLAPVIVASVAILATIGVIIQRHRSDSREHWWKRFSWALEQSLAPESAESQMLGLVLMDALTSSKRTIPRKDRALVARVVLPYLPSDSGQEGQIEDNEISTVGSTL